MASQDERTPRELWEEAYREDPEQSVPADEILDPELAGLAPGRALDLGCGSGRNCFKLARLGWAVLGVDWAGEAVAIARATARAMGLGVRFEVTDMTTWRSPQRFDLVICVFALPGGANNSLALRTAAGSLAPGGTLLVVDWDPSMAAAWGLDPEELLSPAQIVALLPGLRIVKATVLPLTVASPDSEAGTEVASVALVRAVRP